MHQLQDRVAELQGVVAAQTAAEARWRAERAALLSQLDTLNDQLVRAQHKIEAMEADGRRMAQVNKVILHQQVQSGHYTRSCYFTSQLNLYTHRTRMVCSRTM